MRKSLGKSISDGLLPAPIVKLLYKPLFTESHYPINLINGYSLMHFISGVVIGRWDVVQNWIQALVLHTVWELFQFTVGDNTFEQEDLLFDIPFDTMFFMLGWVIAKKIDKK